MQVTSTILFYSIHLSSNPVQHAVHTFTTDTCTMIAVNQDAGK